ncbi:MAG: hypothetical protein PF693_13390 [Spirochaetia bacterium]|nr:hypothetical protein [Spirochaetia bacterium]
MSNEDRILLTKLLREISELRGEMKEFKEQTIYRLNHAEKSSEERQNDPSKCTVGRSLKDHLGTHGERKESGRSVIFLVLETGMFAAMILIAVFK